MKDGLAEATAASARRNGSDDWGRRYERESVPCASGHDFLAVSPLAIRRSTRTRKAKQKTPRGRHQTAGSSSNANGTATPNATTATQPTIRATIVFGGKVK